MNDELLAHPKKVPQGGGNSEILQWMESTIIQTSNQENKGISEQKERGNQVEAPVSSTRKPQARKPPKKGGITRKRSGGNHITPVTGSQESKKIPWKLYSTWLEPCCNSRKKRNKE
ncbi:hypothetical protein O181_013523 [Austropuccinia psidii MF-1]|uniref:Uncharacterized protein n=1 Tax=Austropuccinia psidii MF-1 TaxID=1389203 RepID=A0A9Q3BYV0_9BASI|nr:hypothetical protein [Austropuccinia psidii MF-1]